MGTPHCYKIISFYLLVIKGATNDKHHCSLDGWQKEVVLP